MNGIALLLAGFAIGYVVGSLFYRPPKHGSKYTVTEITSADLVKALKK